MLISALVSYDVTDSSLPCYSAFESLLEKVASLNLKNITNDFLYAALVLLEPADVARFMKNCNWVLR